MRFLTLLTLLGSALANPLMSRDLATMQKAITSVQGALTQLDTAVKGLSTDPSSAAPLLTASQNAQGVIKQATSDITATSALSLTDALSLQQSATSLTTAVNSTVNDLVAKKPVLDQLGVTSVAVQTLQQQKTDSAALGKAIVSKVPSIGQSIAQQSIGQINTVIDSAIQRLSASNGTAAPKKRAMAVPVRVM